MDAFLHALGSTYYWSTFIPTFVVVYFGVRLAMRRRDQRERSKQRDRAA